MPLQWNTRTPFFGVFLEHECPRCHREVRLPLGEICVECRRAIERRAGRIGRWVAGVSALGMALYVWVRMPAEATARTVGVIAVIAWYVLTFLIVKRVLREYFR